MAAVEVSRHAGGDGGARGYGPGDEPSPVSRRQVKIQVSLITYRNNGAGKNINRTILPTGQWAKQEKTHA